MCDAIFDGLEQEPDRSAGECRRGRGGARHWAAATALRLPAAFSASADANPAEKSRRLAEGISEAMSATTYGLVVGLLAVVPMIVCVVRLSREMARRPRVADPTS